MEPDIVSVTADLHVNKHSATALRAEPVEALLLPLAAEGRGDKALPAAHDRSVQAGAESFTRRIEFIST